MSSEQQGLSNGASHFTHRSPLTAHRSLLIKLPSLPIRFLVHFKRLLARGLRLLLSRFEDALFAAADALVRVQTFEDEFRCRNLQFGTLFLRNSQWTEL